MKLADIFCDNMVLQRDKDICIFGEGKGYGKISFMGEEIDFESDTEQFRVYLPAKSAGGPYDMQIELDGEKSTIKNIFIGDVLIAAGQSNMEFPLSETVDIDIIENDMIRCFKEPNDVDEAMNVRYENKGWQLARKENIPSFTAVGYACAVEIYKKTNVPIGIVSCNKGATRVDAWTDLNIVNTDAYQNLCKIKHPDYEIYRFNQKSLMYYSKLLKIVPYSVCGVLWYQGESNRGAEEAKNYSVMLDIMIDNWRRLWDDELKFFLVQLMPYEDEDKNAAWQLIRECQEKISKTKDGVYLSSLCNTGDKCFIHPTHKKLISEMLANAVLNKIFGFDTEYCGPVYKEVCLSGNSAIISFEHGEGLCIRGGKLSDTFVIGKDGEKCDVSAKIEDNRLVLSWSENLIAERIEMGYNNAPEHNLYNRFGYLASPFCIRF